MPMRKYKPEQILTLLRQVEVELANGKAEVAGGGAVFGEADSEGRRGGKLSSPERRRGAVRHARESYRVSERHACRLLGQWRGTQRYEVIYRTDEDALTREIVALASEYGRYGYRRITALLRDRGWHAGKDRVQRIWRREGLKVPQRTKAARQIVVERRIVPSLAAGTSESCVELRFRERHDARRKNAADADADRRVHTGVFGDLRREKTGKVRSDRSAGGRDAVSRNPGKHSYGNYCFPDGSHYPDDMVLKSPRRAKQEPDEPWRRNREASPDVV